MGLAITREDLARAFPRPKSGERRIIWDGYVEALTSPEGAVLLAQYGITSPLRWQHLAATFGVETGGLTILWESGAYSAEALLNTFGAHRHSAGITPAEAKKLARNGPAIFERVYGLGNPRKAKELGNTEPGDGWRFRGLGLNQMTGRWMHTEAAKQIGCSLEELKKPINLLHAALIEWERKGCNQHADRDDLIAVRKLINAGSLKVSERRLNGVPQARQYLALAKRVWPESGAKVPDPANDLLALGARGPRVEDLQRELAESGFPCGDPDGVFGPLTERALAAFQVSYGLPASGKACDATWAALREAGPAAPVRDLTATDLVKRGSRTVKLWGRIVALGRALYAAAFGTVALEASGVDVVEQAVTSGERVAAVVDRVAPSGVFDARTAIIAGLCALGVLGWFLSRSGKQGVEARVDDANTAANVRI